MLDRTVFHEGTVHLTRYDYQTTPHSLSSTLVLFEIHSTYHSHVEQFSVQVLTLVSSKFPSRVRKSSITGHHIKSEAVKPTCKVVL